MLKYLLIILIILLLYFKTKFIMNIFDNIKLKSYQKNFIFIFSVSFLYFFPLFTTGSGRLVDYTTTHFSLLILSENLFSPYTFFTDLIGPGTKLPLGSGLYNFFPTSLFIQNYFLFFHIYNHFLDFIFK